MTTDADVGFDGAPAERSEVGGHRQQIGKICSTDSGGTCPRSRRASAAAVLNDHQKLAMLTCFAALTRARIIGKNKATADQPPLLKLFYKESDSNERLRVSDWIVQRL